MKILYVEDNEDNIYMLERRLKRAGFDMLIARDGAQGVAMALAEQPALVLMDLGLPVLDGYEDATDTGDCDLTEAAQRATGGTMVTVRGLVRALTVLLDRHDVRERLVAQRGDEEREAYVSLGLTEANAMALDGHLEDEDANDVMQLGAW